MAPGKLPSSSMFATLTATKCASASYLPQPEEQLDEEENREFEGGQMQLKNAIAEMSKGCHPLRKP